MKGHLDVLQLLGLRVACAVFAVACLVQLVRLFAGAEVSVDGHFVPLWASAVAAIFAGGLSAWMAQLSYYRGAK